LEEGGEFLQLVVVQHPIPLAILGDVLGFQHPAVLSLFKNEVGGLVTGHGSSGEIRKKRTESADRWAGWRAKAQLRPTGESGFAKVAYWPLTAVDRCMVLTLADGIMRYWAWLQAFTSKTVFRGAVGRAHRGSGRFGRGGWRACPAWALSLSHRSLASLRPM